MTSEQADCFVVSKDLMFSSQVSNASSSAGLNTKTVLSHSDVGGDKDMAHYVILDLNLPGLDIATAVTELKSRGATVIAVGPHVHEAKLDSAREAGCDRVLTKGQASRELGAVLAELCTSE